jgi:RNA polymerase sigma-70 factor (ECF subfamily)
MSGANETHLLQRLLHDDSAAWREIVEKYSGLLLATSRRTFASYGFAASEQDCEDAVAEDWRNLLQNDRQLLRRCIAQGEWLPTLHVLTRNRSVGVMRRRKCVSVPLDALVEETPAEESEQSFDPELAELLPQALATLSARERSLVDLVFLHNKKYREIELLLCIPQNSIGPTLTRTMAKLRKAISDSRKENYAIENEPG